ncbi:hypothetical protein SLS53_007975 [Cytospora paraplurivora]|uniref:Uncharacterized protein n=1 Tax=Cytospora paraplurivora TaxID=2898453 RepID=A0AAN9YCJ5_9PEZI
MKGSRPRGRASPTPISSTNTAPSQTELDVEDAINGLDIGALTLDVPIVNKKPVVEKPKPFPIMDLPSELRVKIYDYHFADIGPVVDIEPGNYFAIHKKLCIFRVCRQIYHEASHAFYSSKTFRIFPIDGRYAKAKKGLLARLKPQSRAHITSLELRLGPGWSKPYRSWVVNELLGLQDCHDVRSLSVFVEIDPSDPLFNGWRKSNGFYESFSKSLLGEILEGLPSLKVVRFDAGRSVKKAGDMMQGLLEVTKASKLNITWGPIRGWTDNDADEPNYESPVGPTTAIDWSLSPSNIMSVLAQQEVVA